MEKKLRVGVLGATGMVGQRFISLLENHPWYEVVTVAQKRAYLSFESYVFSRFRQNNYA